MLSMCVALLVVIPAGAQYTVDEVPLPRDMKSLEKQIGMADINATSLDKQIESVILALRESADAGTPDERMRRASAAGEGLDEVLAGLEEVAGEADRIMEVAYTLRCFETSEWGYEASRAFQNSGVRVEAAQNMLEKIEAAGSLEALNDVTDRAGGETALGAEALRRGITYLRSAAKSVPECDTGRE